MLKKRLAPALVILIVFGAGIAGGGWLISNLGSILSSLLHSLPIPADAADVARGIAGQLSTAAVSVGWILPAAAAGLFALLRFALPPKNGGLVFLYVLAAILLWLACAAATVALSRLGGIRVLDIVTSVSELIKGGVLDAL